MRTLLAIVFAFALSNVVSADVVPSEPGSSYHHEEGYDPFEGPFGGAERILRSLESPQ